MVWPTSGSQISTTIRSALSRSLVALISIQPQDAGLRFKGRARVVTESEKCRGTLIIWQLPSAALQTGPLFTKDRYFYSAAQITRIRSGTNKSPMNLAPKSIALSGASDTSTLS